MNLQNIFEELLTELDGEQIRQKYYQEIPLNVFLRIIRSDPKTRLSYDPDRENAILPSKIGKYSKIILDLYKNNNLNLEDLPKVTEYLEAAYKYNVPIDNANVNSLSDIYNLVRKYLAVGQIDPELTSQSLDKNEFKILHDGKKWKIYQPITERAACYLGAGTQWCTTWGKHSLNPSHTSRSSQFSTYNKQGSLYIIVNKTNPEEKYQFHFETNQYMDKDDRSIKPEKLIQENPELKNFFFKSLTQETNTETKIFELTHINLLPTSERKDFINNTIPDEYKENHYIKMAIENNNSGGYVEIEIDKPTYNINDVHGVIRFLESQKYNSDDSIRETISQDDHYDIEPDFESYYKKNHEEVRKYTNITNYHLFKKTYLEDFLSNEKIINKYIEEAIDLSSENYQNQIQSEINDIQQKIKFTENYYGPRRNKLDVHISTAYLVKFIFETNFNNEDEEDMIDEYIDHYNLTSIDEIYPEYNYPTYDDNDKYKHEIDNYFFDVFFDIDYNDDQNDECVRTQKEFNKIVGQYFKNSDTIENDIAILKINNFEVDCEDETVYVTFHNKQTGQTYEGDIKFKNISNYINNYKLFESLIIFKKCL